jgi:hypothetical protein
LQAWLEHHPLLPRSDRESRIVESPRNFERDSSNGIDGPLEAFEINGDGPIHFDCEVLFNRGAGEG